MLLNHLTCLKVTVFSHWVRITSSVLLQDDNYIIDQYLRCECYQQIHVRDELQLGRYHKMKLLFASSHILIKTTL